MNYADKCCRIANACEDRATALPLQSNGCRSAAFYAWLRAARRFNEAASDVADRKAFRDWLRHAAYSVREAMTTAPTRLDERD